MTYILWDITFRNTYNSTVGEIGISANKLAIVSDIGEIFRKYDYQHTNIPVSGADLDPTMVCMIFGSAPISSLYILASLKPCMYEPCLVLDELTYRRNPIEPH